MKIILILSCFDLVILAPVSCKAGWELYNGACYKLFTLGTTWEGAYRACYVEGAQLLSIHSAAENDFVRSIFNKRTVTGWIGFNEIAGEGSFVWSDGSPKSYTYWDYGGPIVIDGRKDCTFTTYLGKWYVSPCSSILPFICKY